MWRERLRNTNPRLLFAGFLATLMIVSFFLDEVTDVIQQRDMREQNQRFRSVIDGERKENRKVRDELLEGQDYLREQLTAVVAFIRAQGYDIPSSVLTPRVTYRESNDDDDDDDDGGDRRTTVVVPPPQGSDSPSGSGGPSVSAPEEDEDLRIPELPVGEATDTAKRIIEDLPDILDME